MSELILLPCHAIWKPTLADLTGIDQSEWALVDFQRAGHDHLCFREHVQWSLDRLAQNANAQVVISGGQTKRASGPVSEAYSYYQLAERMTKDKSLLERVWLEEYARDSFENVLFALCRYHQVNGRFPDSLTVVGFQFKRKRFCDLHLALLNWTNPVTYIGNEPDPKELSESDRQKYFEDLEASEHTFAVQLFEDDWFGARGKLLAKKLARDPFKRVHGYNKVTGMAAVFEAIEAGASNEVIRDSIKWD